MSASDAVILLLADGFVAVGRVLGGLRRRCDTERRADAVDALNALEDNQDGLEPGQLGESVAWEAQSNRFSRDAIEALNDARWCGVHATVVAFCKDRHRASAEAPECWACGCPASRHVGNAGIHWPCEDCDCVDLLLQEYAEKRSAAVTVPAADNTRCPAAASIAGDPFLCGLDTGHAGPHHNPHQKASWIDAGADEGTAAELFAIGPADRTDQTDQTIHLEAAFNYHKGAVGYAAMRAGGVEWFCEGCSWSGPTKQAHARHRFQVLADMSAATGRVNEQLGGAS